jgi:hypothetical protein
MNKTDCYPETIRTDGGRRKLFTEVSVAHGIIATGLLFAGFYPLIDGKVKMLGNVDHDF